LHRNGNVGRLVERKTLLLAVYYFSTSPAFYLSDDFFWHHKARPLRCYLLLFIPVSLVRGGDPICSKPPRVSVIRGVLLVLLSRLFFLLKLRSPRYGPLTHDMSQCHLVRSFVVVFT